MRVSIKGNPKTAVKIRPPYIIVVLLSVPAALYYIILRSASSDISTGMATGAVGLRKAPSYKLAYDQSFGFFDDISDEVWKVKQQNTASAFPNYSNLPAEVTKVRMFYAQNYHAEFSCPDSRRLPPTGAGDGPKWICDPHRLAKKKDCLVYSIGSNGEFDFEKSVLEDIGSNCEVHTFDVFTSNDRYEDFSERVSPYAHFHHWGIGPSPLDHFPIPKNDKIHTPKDTGPIKTLSQTMDDLGHTGRTIDVFKIDCEGCEWETYRDWLKQDIRQILVETHHAPMPHINNFFHDLHDAGFVIFGKEPNLYYEALASEFAMIRLAPEFFVKGTKYSELN